MAHETILHFKDGPYSILAINLVCIFSAYFFLGLIFIFLYKRVLPALCVSYITSEPVDRFYWTLRVVKIIGGTHCVAVSIWGTLADEALAKDVALASTLTSNVVLSITVGYFLLEFSADLVLRFKFDRKGFWVSFHHILCVLTYFEVVFSGKGHYYAVRLVMMECILPLQSISWILHKSGLQHTRMWKANSLLLVKAYNARTWIEVSTMFSVVGNFDVIVKKTPVYVVVLRLMFLITSMFALTPYWTHLMTKRVYNELYNIDISKRTRGEMGDVMKKAVKFHQE
ncbi:hypothetical protein DPMN_008242 [Dreissena polymorpha]|uniref:TLC domain-containing protein n=1 Tax=Dreissena polymorpha TaxID=45954 RepID=A0A9D4RYY8_DREPO|nr:hypothetical protein DPMN_008242 [Dreissena polymorpha]